TTYVRDETYSLPLTDQGEVEGTPAIIPVEVAVPGATEPLDFDGNGLTDPILYRMAGNDQAEAQTLVSLGTKGVALSVARETIAPILSADSFHIGWTLDAASAASAGRVLMLHSTFEAS